MKETIGSHLLHPFRLMWRWRRAITPAATRQVTPATTPYGDFRLSLRYRRNPAIEAAPLQQEMILFEPGANRFLLLNGTAAFLWEQLEQPATAEQLSDEVCRHYEGVDKSAALEDVHKALGGVAGAGRRHPGALKPSPRRIHE